MCDYFIQCVPLNYTTPCRVGATTGTSFSIAFTLKPPSTPLIVGVERDLEWKLETKPLENDLFKRHLLPKGYLQSGQ